MQQLRPWLTSSRPESTLWPRYPPPAPRPQTMLVERIASEAGANLLVVTPSGVLSKWWVAAGLLPLLDTFAHHSPDA